MRSASCAGNAAAALCLALVLVGCGKAPPPAAARSEAPAAAQRSELDRGVGLMGRFEFDAAREVFERLARGYPDWVEARLDLALATMNRQREGDEQAATEILRALAREHPDDARVAYVLGLLLLHGGAAKDAEPLLRKAAQADGSDAYARYFLGQSLLAQGRAEEALRAFDEASALDARLRSADYGASQALSRLGRGKEASERLAQFERTRNNPLARLAEFKYTRMGAKAEAVGAAAAAADRGAPPTGALFAEPEILAKGEGAWRSRPVASAAVMESESAPRLYLPMGMGRKGAVPGSDGDGLARVADVEFAAWGDIDNDGLADVLLCSAGAPPALLMQKPRGQWTPRELPLLKALGPSRDCALFDADHDGDLDLFLVTAKGERALLSNNGDGSFRALKLPGASSRTATQVVAADLDDDRDIDLVILHEGAAHEVLENDRLWSWRAARGFEAFAKEPAVAAVASRSEADGEARILTLAPDLAVRSWKKDRDGRWAATMLVPGSGAPAAGTRAQIAVADIDGDGIAEIVATTAKGVGIWKSSGAKILEIAAAPVVSWTLVALDARGPSLVTYQADGSVVVRRPGPGRFPFAQVSLTGGDARSAQSRSNASGVGTRVAARIAGRWVTADTLRDSSGPGQSLVPLAIGLGGAPKIDYLSIDWPDGVFQSELALDATRPHHIVETQRQLSSCPLIFAWNGEGYGFVSDFLGVGGLGYLVAPGEYAKPRPWENFLFPEGAIREKGERVVIKIGEPMEESAYLDSMRLVAHDLPAGWDMALDERMQIGEPKVTGRTYYFRREAQPLRATNDRGEDVTASLARADLHAAPPGDRDPRFIGRLARDHVLTLEFDRDLDASKGQALLVADGWIEYPYSQTMFAAWQAKADYRAPTLEARGADGRWRVVLDQFGYPAGMPRRMAVPLPRLPRGTRALRLRTNQEIYWDRIAVAWPENASAVARPLMLAAADVRRAGFPRRTTGAQQQPSYDYSHRDPLWDTRTQSGRYTAYGPVTQLVAQRDDGLAIIGPGDELHLEYQALPAVAPGFTRRYVLESRGWAKDMDLYTRDGDSVGPVPASGMDAKIRDSLNERFNTRYASGR
jgi:tetratricopeptide (TPR) repeat protein